MVNCFKVLWFCEPFWADHVSDKYACVICLFVAVSCIRMPFCQNEASGFARNCKKEVAAVMEEVL